MKKFIYVLLLVALAFVCFVGQTAHATGTGEGGRLQFGGKTFPISIGEIGKDDQGHTTVEILTDNLAVATKKAVDFSSVDALGGLTGDAIRNVIRVKIVTKGKAIESTEYSIKGRFGIHGALFTLNDIVFHFDTAAKPEKIIVYNDDGSSLTFNGKTKKLMK